MRNLYLALGFPSIVNDHDALAHAVRKEGVSNRVEEQVLFVLLQPARKSRYDWALEKALELAEARSQLGLPPPAHFQLPAPWTIPGGRGNRAPFLKPQRARSGGWVMGLLTLAGLIWLGAVVLQSSKPREAVPAAPTPNVGTDDRTGRASNQPIASLLTRPVLEPSAIPPPSHGWLQGSPGLALRVPWRIETEPGQGYLLTLLEAKSKAVVLTLFLRGGEPYLGRAPEGEFEWAYTSGTRWLGFPQAFGPEARTVRSEQIHRVHAGPDDSWVWELELHPTSGEGSQVEPVRPTVTPVEQ
jgi:hypothetical protein